MNTTDTKVTTSTLRHLVTLGGQGDLFYILVTPDVYAWINQPYRGKTASTLEPVPQTVQDEMKRHGKDVENAVRVSRGSPDNDRALQAPGVWLNTMGEVMDYLKTHELTLSEDEYAGFCY